MANAPTKPRARPTPEGGWTMRTTDNYVNPFNNLGAGTANLSSGGYYRLNPITRDRTQLEWVYRANWVARMIVDAKADDMTREGVDIQSDDKPEDIHRIHKVAETLRIWSQLGKAIKWARLYGGSLAYLMIDGQNPQDPLDVNSVGEGKFLGIMPLDRWMAWPDTTDIISDLTPDFGLPRMYKLWPDAQTQTPSVNIHYSRLVRFDGVALPYWQRVAENYWGLSCLEPVWDRMMAFDSATQGAAQLVYKAHLRTVRVKDLREMLGTNDQAAQQLQQFFSYVRMFQSNEGLTVLDKEDEFDVKSYSFAGLSDMMQQFAQQLAGASGYPMVRFYGQSPGGLNATGESDWRNYYDNVLADQERELRPGVELIYSVLYRSALGRKPAAGKPYTINFRPLWQMTDDQSAEVASKTVTAVMACVNGGLFGRSLGLKELKGMSATTGFGTNISQDDIDQAQTDEKQMREDPPTAEQVRGVKNPDIRILAKPESGADERPGTEGARKKPSEARNGAAAV